MKTFLFISLLLLAEVLGAQTVLKSTKPMVFPEHSFYMLCRGTQLKVGLIAHRFNLSDPYSTHVGIALVENGSLTVYSVNNDTGDKSALIREKLNSFIDVKDVFYWSIWECKSTAKQMLLLKKILQFYRSKKIIFDMDFEPNNNKLYCSEFCAEILKVLSPGTLTFALTRKPLDLLFRGALSRNTLHYYPVDFFQSNTRFKKIYETHYP